MITPMAKNDGVKTAAEAAEELLKGKIGLIEALSAAKQAETPIKSLLASVRHAARDAPEGGGREELLKAAALVDEALQAARKHIGVRKQEALAGGWTTADLTQLGLVATRTKRKQAAASPRDADDAAEDTAPRSGTSADVA